MYKLLQIVNINDFVINNKWKILFIVFGILIAFALGKKMGISSDKEDFEEDIKMEQDTLPSTSDDKEPIDDKINRAIDKGDKNVKVVKTPKPIPKHKCKKVDLTEYVHKSLVPDLDYYVSKDDLDRYYISKRELDKKYMKKDSCKPPEIDYTEYISRDDLKKYYLSKRTLEKEYIKKEDCDCSVSTEDDEPEVIQEVTIKKKKKIVEIPEIIYKKVPVEINKPELKLIKPLEVKTIQKTIKKSPKVIDKPKCIKIDTTKKQKDNQLTQQLILEKNINEMTDTYAKVDDDYSYCNAKSCINNGLPNGLMTLNNK